MKLHSTSFSWMAFQLLLHEVVPGQFAGFGGDSPGWQDSMRGERAYVFGAFSIAIAAMLCTAKPISSTSRALFLAILANVMAFDRLRRYGSDYLTAAGTLGGGIFVVVMTFVYFAFGFIFTSSSSSGNDADQDNKPKTE
jgi:hypothetical protein